MPGPVPIWSRTAPGPGGWSLDIAKVGGAGVDFPIIADPNHTVSELYDMLHPGEGDASTVRSVVHHIDPANKVRLTLTYPKSGAATLNTILRVIDALQLTDAQPVARIPRSGSYQDGCNGVTSAL